MIKFFVFLLTCFLFFNLDANMFSDNVPEALFGPKIDQEFMPYIVGFIYYSNGKVTVADFSKLSIKFKKYPPADSDGRIILGTCNYGFGVWNNYITFNEDWWKNKYVSDLERWVTFVHESGHCVLNREHPYELDALGSLLLKIDRFLVLAGVKKSSYFLEDGCPITLMNPTIVNLYCINKHYTYYLKELYE